jgi:uncharacterized coiled-coil protein SlyX
VACGLLAFLLLGSIAAATDVTITDASPELFFVDTSPAYNWKIRADSLSFDVIDITEGSIPFTISHHVPDFSLTIGLGGTIGMGTLTPLADLHVKTASSFASLRLESAGTLIPYQWELRGDDQDGFALVDVTNGGSISFFINAGAPSDSLVVNSAGNVGFGIGAPTAPIHVKKKAQAATAEILARFAVSDDATGSLVIANSSAGDGLFIPKITGRSASQNAAMINDALITNDVGASPAIVYNAAKNAGGPLVTRPLVVYRNNSIAKVTIAANGDVNATSFNPSSSREMKEDIVDLDAASASEALRSLTPVKYVYKDDESKEPRVGFIAEDVPEIVANADRKSVPIMDVVALVTRVVKDQQQTIDEQKKSIVRQQVTNDQQQKTIDLLMKRLEALESQASAGR